MNGIMRALEKAIQNNLLKIAFPPLANGVFGLSTDMCATIMLQTMRDFITKNSHLLLKIIHVVINNIQQTKKCSLVLWWQMICYITCAKEFIIFYSYILMIYQRNLANCFQSKYLNKLFHFWKFFDIAFYLSRNLIVLFFYSMWSILISQILPFWYE